MKDNEFDAEFESIVAGEIDDAINYIDEEISPQRSFATQYYRGETPDLEADQGRSQMVSRDVRDTVMAILPSIMRVFFSSDRVVEYLPATEEDVPMAEQATDYANYVLQQDNDFFNTFYCVAKDALIRKCGFVKAWWHEAQETITQRYTGLDEMTLLALTQDGAEVEVLGQNVAPDGTVMYDCRVSKTEAKKGRIKVEAVPPEELLVSRRDKMLGESFVAHRKMMTLSELVAMGYDKEEMEQYTTDSGFEDNEEYIVRTNRARYEVGSIGNDAMRRALYVESYVRIDRNGDGIAELLKVCTIGSGHKVLMVEEVNAHPFVAFPCDPEPHLSPVEAFSVADDLMDLQRLKSAIFRNTLDSLAQTINPRTVVTKGAEMEDVLNNEVGAIIRANTINDVMTLTQPDVSGQGLQMLAYADSIKETRTGMSKMAMGLDPDALRNTTATAASGMISAYQTRLEMLTRTFANGLRDLFKLLLRLMTTHQEQARVTRLRNEWVSVDPRQFNSQMDVVITVALGSGTNEQQFNVLAGIAQKQELIMSTMGLQNPLVSLQQYAKTLSRMAEKAGLKDTQSYVTQLPDDFQMPPAPPQQDPNAQAAELLAQVEREKAQAKMQIDAAKLQADQQLQAAKLQLEREKFQADMARKQLELEMQEQKIMAELRLKEAEAVLKQLTQLKGGQDYESQNANAEAGQEASEARQEGLLAQAILTVGRLNAESQMQMARALTASKKITRNDKGLIDGTQTIMPMNGEME